MKSSDFSTDLVEEFVEKDWYPLAMDPKIGFDGSNDFPNYNFELSQRDDLYCSSTSPLPAELAATENENMAKNLEENNKRKKVEDNDSTKAKSQINQEIGKDENENEANKNKDEIVHLRAKRGQAINSHSLAERLRRKKISERMRLLQDLVPGCSKITAKAVMLDEIINYVQSLQQQVEFLSMKLSTVKPDISMDLEHLLSKQGIMVPGQGLVQQEMWYGTGTSNQIPRVTAMPQVSGLWGQEVQNNIGTINAGFISNVTPHKFNESDP